MQKKKKKKLPRMATSAYVGGNRAGTKGPEEAELNISKYSRACLGGNHIEKKFFFFFRALGLGRRVAGGRFCMFYGLAFGPDRPSFRGLEFL